MHRFLHVGFAFPGVPKIRDLELPMSYVGDWVRYGPLCWLVWTDKPVLEAFNILRQYVDANDQLLLAKIDPLDSMGHLPPWIWQWINSKSTQPTIEVSDFWKMLPQDTR